MEEIFGPSGLIAKHHPDYEYRPGQVAMANAVAAALSKSRHLLVEAGTGTGKTLAYLVPAIALGRRVIISTGTKNLQEQLFYKDVPFLQSILPKPFRATYLKGRSNYLCLLRLQRSEMSPVLEGLEEVDYFDDVRRWAYETKTGDRAELKHMPENIGFWRHIDARSDICVGSKCPNFDPCFITKARQAAIESEIIIVNHHLFFADLALRGREYGQVLPDYSAVIFDEAHQLEDVASMYFGSQVSSYQIDDLVGDISRLMITDVQAAIELTKASARVTRFASQFWMSFTGQDRGASLPITLNGDGRFAIRQQMFVRKERNGQLTPTPVGERFTALKNALERLRSGLEVVKDAPPEMDAILRRVEQVLFDLEFIILGDDRNFIYWAERRGRGVFLQATPIDVSGLLSDKLFNLDSDNEHRIESVILTSATMTSANSFEFIRDRLGIEASDELVADSNFDYQNQAIMYLPPNMPDPRDGRFTEAAANEIVKIINASKGRAFVLCTSNSSMDMLRDLVAAQVDFPIFKQGEGSRTGILEKFRNTPNAVLFATSSFWQGVDVRGEALSCVIIDKLPFAVPSDPVVAARQRFIDATGGSSFSDYSVPSAIITLKQGLGRLIRSTTDRGVLSVLDPRLTTKAYGKTFLNSLPQCRITQDIADVEQFFGNN
ncbi:MAG: ATP-dependent DNA helicase [Acidobacteria bacterium]|nr:ATP-dependent DNA helicase [Acidobacteriota bacterium]